MIQFAKEIRRGVTDIKARYGLFGDDKSEQFQNAAKKAAL